MPRTSTATARQQPISRPARAGSKPVVEANCDAAAIERAPGEERSSAPDGLTKLDRLVALLQRPEGASLSELASATGWQAHSIRGAIAGPLKRKGHVVVSERIDGTRRYRIEVLP